ncbi:hypothetical protein Z947_411 [Sulfitobacter geojensis]|nr:hypothetical protein Z947_411 [Sulfitobacter geojensis]
MKTALKQVLSNTVRYKLRVALTRANTLATSKRLTLPDSLQQKISLYFRKELEELEILTDLDLKNWYKV